MSLVRKEDALMTSQEMLDRSSTWTLACDNALLNRLKGFSENLTRNWEEVQKECDFLSKDVTQLDYRLMNLTNEFLMLSNNQFVENRVEEFEEYAASLPPPTPTVTFISKSKAEKEAELISKMKHAIQLGLTACSSRKQQQYDDTTTHHFRRKFPFVIGSPKFFSSRFCGLIDESRRMASMSLTTAEEFLAAPDSDSLHEHQNYNASETNHTPTTENKPVVHFTMPPVPVFPQQAPPLAERYGGGEKQDEVEHISVRKPNGPPSPNFSDNSSNFGTSSTASKENITRSVTDELKKIYSTYAPPAPVDDDSDDDFRPVASSRGIFDGDDEDDDDDLFGEKDFMPSTKRNTDFFGRSNPPKLSTPVFSASVPPPLTSHSEPEVNAYVPHIPENDLVATETLVGDKPKLNDTPRTKRESESANDFGSRNVQKQQPVPEPAGFTRSKLPAGAVSVFGGLPPPIFNSGSLKTGAATAVETTRVTATAKAPAVVTSPFPTPTDNQNEETQTHSTSTVFPTRKTEKKEDGATTKPKIVNVNKANFQPTHHSHANVPQITDSNNHQQKQSSLGSNFNEQSRSIKKVTASALFADESSDEDLFFSSSNRNKRGTSSVTQAQKPKVNAKNDLWSQSSSSPILPVKKNVTFSQPDPKIVTQAVSSSSTKTQPSRQSAKKSIFDDSESDEDIFKSRPPTSLPKTTTQKTQNTNKKSALENDPKKGLAVQKKILTIASKKSSSLFGEDSSDSDTDLFGNKKNRKIVGVQPAKATVAQPSRQVQMEVAAATEIILGHQEPQDLFENMAEVEKTQSKICVEIKSKVSNNNENEEDDEDLFKENICSLTTEKESSEKERTMHTKELESEPEPEPQPKSQLKEENNSNSRTKTKSIFEDSESSDDDLFSSKSKSIPAKSVEPIKPKHDSPKVVTKKISSQKQSVKTTTSLFGNDSDSDSDLFVSKAQPKKANKSKPFPSSDPEDETDVNSESQGENVKLPVSGKGQSDEVDAKMSSLKLKSKDISEIEAQSGAKSAVGNKIADRIKAMQNSSNDSSKKDAESDEKLKNSVKPSVSVKNLALSLKINPLALKVGAKPPKQSGSGSGSPSTANTPDNDEDDDGTKPFINHKSSPSTPEAKTPNSPGNASTPEEKEADSSDTRSDVTASSSAGGDHFVDIIKSRAKIQRKRRPPSRLFLKSLALQEEENESATEKQKDSSEAETESTPPEDTEQSVINKTQQVDDGSEEATTE